MFEHEDYKRWPRILTGSLFCDVGVAISSKMELHTLEGYNFIEAEKNQSNRY